MKKLGEVAMIQSNRININNKTHLNSFNRDKDTLRSKNFEFPESDTETLEIINGKIYLKETSIDTDNFCQEYLDIFINNNK